MQNNQQLKLLLSHRNYIEIVFLISHGLANKNIAHALNLSARTVSAHRSAIFKITDCKNALELVVWAVNHQVNADPDLLARFNIILRRKQTNG